MRFTPDGSVRRPASRRRLAPAAVTALAAGAMALPAASVAAPSVTAPAAPAGSTTVATAPVAVVPSARAKKKKRKSSIVLTILHNNDGESKLLGAPADADFGGVARFTTLAKTLKRIGTNDPRPRRGAKFAAVTLSSGDNFLAGPEFNASLEKGVPFYDSIALDRVGYDAMAIGNHEFDFGPDVLADFITGFGPTADDRPPFVSANLAVGAEPALAELAADGTLVKRTVVVKKRERIGVVGATTPALRSISSPRDVRVRQDVAGIVQRQVDFLTSRGVNKIILVSHLQDIDEDRDLVGRLSGVDVAIAGGGDELLANQGDLLVPGDEISTDANGAPLSYPLYSIGADGRSVPIVTTAGDYKYLGRLVVRFNRQGDLVRVWPGSGPVRVSGVAPDAVAPNPFVQANVVEPVQAYVDDLDQTVLAQSQVALEGRRDPGVRTQETNLGDLLADALLYAGQQRAAEYDVAAPDVALQNGGGIRNNSLIPAGDLTELDTFSIAPFGNFVSVVPDISASQFKEILENAVSAPAGDAGISADGQFAQVAGFSFTYDLSGQAQEVNDAGDVLVAGTRVQSVVLDDGTVLVEDGAVNTDAAPISVATNDFSARGGDQYPFRGADFTTVGLTYQQALADYLVNGLGGVVSSDQYPEGGEGRISTVQ